MSGIFRDANPVNHAPNLKVTIMSELTQKDVSEAVLSYVDRERARMRRQTAERHFYDALDDMTRRFGAEMTISVLVRYVGQILIEGAHRALIRISCGYLAKCIARSVMARLTGRRTVH